MDTLPNDFPDRHAGIYRYDTYDRAFLAERVAEFRDQVARRQSGELTEEEFKPLRLMNGLYLQLHAYMLRVAIPYGFLSATQLRALAAISRKYDRGYGHFTTRQNLQLNWPRLEETPDILQALADVDLHALQTSGNCIRNVTTDQYAAAAADELVDPRVYAEILRQWSTLHPEFSYLPRKFKIAITGGPQDRAAVKVHDIGLLAKPGPEGAVGFEVWVGGGQGRTPMLAAKARDFLPEDELIAYLEAILRVYNALGRRDNIYKARIKILVHETGAERFVALVEEEFARLPRERFRLAPEVIQQIRARFAAPPLLDGLPAVSPALARAKREDGAFARWCRSNVARHRQPGYAIANISLKPAGGIPGDATADQMDLVADLSERYAFGEIRVAHEQNLVLGHVRQDDLHALWQALVPAGLGEANLGLITDIIACPGLDYCALANARSIPIAQQIGERFRSLERQHDIGPLTLNISGCINACGHHHVAHIGLLGVDKKGEEFYQITLGGNADQDAAIGQILGPAFPLDGIVDAVETVVETYLSRRSGPQESFLAAVRRLGPSPFKEALYGTA
jgi:sulfite reductase (NADPH) hemoprotein beta-component